MSHGLVEPLQEDDERIVGLSLRLCSHLPRQHEGSQCDQSAADCGSSIDYGLGRAESSLVLAPAQATRGQSVRPDPAGLLLALTAGINTAGFKGIPEHWRSSRCSLSPPFAD